jgi:hypothetical protein
MQIREVVARRTDLGTFLVHLTRDGAQGTARENLAAILRSARLEARNMFGAAMHRLRDDSKESQKCVCFTETPLEHLHLLLARIDNRNVHFEPYGIALPKKLGRIQGINPVWYVDTSPGHDWLTEPLREIVNEAIREGFDHHPISKLTPYIERMGTGMRDGRVSYRKEFWWEREWRIVGDFVLPYRVIVLCPESEFEDFRTIRQDDGDDGAVTLLDPRWGIERIISSLAGFQASDCEIF